MPCPVCLNPATDSYLHLEGVHYFRCPSCRAIFADPQSLLAKKEEHARYLLHDNNPGDPGYRTFLEKLALPVNEYLFKPSKGLDYGCGPTPLLAHIMEEQGHGMTYYDPYFFPDTAPLSRTYDFITCSEAAEHFYRPAEEFERLAGMLLPGGILGVMTSLWDESIDFRTWYYRKDPTHVVFYHKKSFLTLAGHLGFSCTFPAKNIIIMQKH
jgi:hypothetical protein